MYTCTLYTHNVHVLYKYSCMIYFRAELSRVRSKLESQFTENSQRELSTVIELKNTTIRECEEKWRKENSDLTKQVDIHIHFMLHDPST